MFDRGILERPLDQDVREVDGENDIISVVMISFDPVARLQERRDDRPGGADRGGRSANSTTIASQFGSGLEQRRAEPAISAAPSRNWPS